MHHTEHDYIEAGHRFEAAQTVDAARARAEILRAMLKREAIEDHAEARRLIDIGRQEARQGAAA